MERSDIERIGGAAGRTLPTAATLLAAGYLAAIALPGLLPAVTVAACVGGCTLVLTLRRTRGLARLLAAVAVWLAAGLAGAHLLADSALGGLAWLALALFLLPLPLIPWAYSRTFATPDSGEAPRPGGEGTG